MVELTAFKQRLRDLLVATGRPPHWSPEESERYMATYGSRREKFEQLARHLNATIFRPRLEALVQSFPNARMGKEGPAERSSCWFGYCERYPVTARIEFAVEHDQQWEKLIVHSETYMMPVFVRYQEQDNLHLPFEGVDDGSVADWMEARLFEFLDCYLQLDRGAPDLDEDTATDPVCGMRIARSTAVGTADHRGHSCFFCSEDCLEKFKNNPAQYVHVEEV